MISISSETIENLRANINDLDESILKAIEYIEKQGMPLLDYQKEYKKNIKFNPLEVIRNAV